ncbi:MAG: hypothetical protein LBP19_03345 [Treponema sp.]|jgi:hypothetical protein|nr:hypothetical protein [Treponema sp.]
MVKIFQTELDRMPVPAARDLRMRLVLSEGIVFKNTWGYQNYVEGNTIYYYLPTLHHGDYETMFAEVAMNKIPQNNSMGTFYLDYQDLNLNQKSMGPYPIRLESFAPNENGEITDPRVREAEGFLSSARGLIDMANKTVKIGSLERDLSQHLNPSPQRADVVQQILVETNQNRSIVKILIDYLTGINNSLGGNKYEKELEILQNYTHTFANVYNAHTNNGE